MRVSKFGVDLWYVYCYLLSFEYISIYPELVKSHYCPIDVGGIFYLYYSLILKFNIGSLIYQMFKYFIYETQRDSFDLLVHFQNTLSAWDSGRPKLGTGKVIQVSHMGGMTLTSWTITIPLRVCISRMLDPGIGARNWTQVLQCRMLLSYSVA